MTIGKWHDAAAAFVVAASLWSGASALADAPPGQYSVMGMGTVRDNRTNLTWQQGVDVNLYEWANAKAYCQALKLAGGGWRLPTVRELQTIVDRRRSNPAIDPGVFPNTPIESFWSDSMKVIDANQWWAVNFGDGQSNHYVATSMFRARCVR